MPWTPINIPSEKELKELQAPFRGKATFLVDESTGIEVSRILSEDAGYNTKFVSEFNLLGLSDEDVFAVAWREQRTIITHDLDFLDDRRFPQHRNPGIVVIGPGADGNDNYGLLACLVKTLLLTGQTGRWLKGKKIEFSSAENLTITFIEDGIKVRNKFHWPTRGNVQQTQSFASKQWNVTWFAPQGWNIGEAQDVERAIVD